MMDPETESVLEKWDRSNPQKPFRKVKFKNFKQALAFVNDVGAIAEAHKHHPDITIRWNEVTLELTTHEAENTLTFKDIKLAKALNSIIH